MENEKEIDIAEVFGSSESRTQRFSVYIPNKDRNGESVPQEQWIDEALKLLSRICGGATEMPPVRGAWLNPETQNLVIEEPVLVYSFIDPEPFYKHINEIVDFVRRVGTETNQGQMAIEFDGVLHLIDIQQEVL
jgi:hypothetical protein